MATGPGKGGRQGSPWCPMHRVLFVLSTETSTGSALVWKGLPNQFPLSYSLVYLLPSAHVQFKSNHFCLCCCLVISGFVLPLPPANFTSTVFFFYISVQIINVESELRWPKKKPFAEACGSQCRDRHGPIYSHFWGFSL